MSCFVGVLHNVDNIWVFFLPAAEETALDDFNDEGCRFFLTHLRVKPSPDYNKIKYTLMFIDFLTTKGQQNTP